MAASIPTFGRKSPGVDYVVRPGVYAVIFNTDGRVAAIHNHGKYYLPGGGVEPGESPKDTLIREVREECGVDVQVGEFLGEAIDYLYAAGENIHFEKRGFFYRATFLAEPVSTDLGWISLSTQENVFRQESHLWAIKAATRLT